jgi:hypothetical protein
MNDEILAHYSYNPETGVITGVRGKPIGSVDDKGYVRIGLPRSIGHGYVRAHRLAWRLMTGEWPDDEIDHVNRVKNDNRWSNLRAADHSLNTRNVGVRKDSKSGVKGVNPHTDVGWVVYIAGEYIGWRNSFFEAVCLRKSAENRLGFIYE